MMKRNTKAGGVDRPFFDGVGLQPRTGTASLGNGGGMWQQNGSGLSAEQQAAAQKSIMTFTPRLTPCASN